MHMLIAGTTGSGKTVLANRMAQSFIADRRAVMVYDPILANWNADAITDKETDFLWWFKKSKNCIAIIDEAGQVVGQNNEPMIRCATQGRHFGHSCIFITQRPKQLSPTVRHNCGALALFRSSPKDCEEMCNDWCIEKLSDTSRLGVGEFYYCERMFKEPILMKCEEQE